MKSRSTLLLAVLAMILSPAVASAADKGNPAKAKQGPAKGKGGEREALETFDDIIKRCDKNGDGAVSHDEFINNQPAGKDPKKSEEWFQSHDLNKDGKLTRDEFMPLPQKK